MVAIRLRYTQQGRRFNLRQAISLSPLQHIGHISLLANVACNITTWNRQIRSAEKAALRQHEEIGLGRGLELAHILAGYQDLEMPPS
jgi:hypothetical protein